MDVSVIIVNYNALRMTADCIDTLFAQTRGVEFEVILVDNGSADGGQAHFRHDGRILFIEAGENLGFGRANNLGLAHARGKYVLFLNNDTLLLNNAMTLLWQQMELLPERVACVGCLLTDREGHAAHSYGRLPRQRDALLYATALAPLSKRLRPARLLDCPPPPAEGSEAFPVGYVTGADLMVRHCVLDELGGFSPHIFMYYEDTELQLRFREHGYESRICRGPRICHLQGASTKRGGKWQREAMISRSRLVYFRLHRPALSFAIFRLLYALLTLPCLLAFNHPWAERKALVAASLHSSLFTLHSSLAGDRKGRPYTQ